MKNKRDSSIRVAARLVRDGVADGVVSAGNTGAVMATVKTVQGMLPGVDRPALASAFPTVKGTPVVVVDVGANVDCSPRMLAQFAVMGDIYSRVIFRTHRPRVGLLSIGEEEHKGNELTRAATPLLKALPIHFIGNVEGRDIYAGKTDVIVCDGFIGNVALKVSEGLVEMMSKMLRESLEATITRKIGSWRAPPLTSSRSAWIIPNTVALRYWASRVFASSRTAAPMPMRSRTRFAWPRNSPKGRSTNGSRPSWPVTWR
jgi:glycerol-3-phosphate acyltransferase PlsX